MLETPPVPAPWFPIRTAVEATLIWLPAPRAAPQALVPSAHIKALIEIAIAGDGGANEPGHRMARTLDPAAGRFPPATRSVCQDPSASGGRRTPADIAWRLAWALPARHDVSSDPVLSCGLRR